MRLNGRRTKRILSALLVAVVLLGVPGLGPGAWAESTQPATDAVVGGGTAGSCTEAALSTALSTVQGSGAGTVTFNCGPAAHTIGLSVYTQISGNVTIDGGNKITLDGNNATAFFQVFNSASLTLKRITLRRGLFTGVYPLDNFGVLTLDRVTLAQNVSGGSAIANYGTLTIRDSTLAENQLTGGGSLAGAALVNDGGTVHVERSTFADNVIAGNSSIGGAIANKNGTLAVSDSDFTGNRAFDGGAIHIGAGTTVTVTQSTFATNSAGYGGAIESWGTRLIVHDSQFEGNRAETGDGGAIWMLGGDLDVERSAFTGNQAATTGGAVSCYGDFVSVIQSTFAANRSTGHGGAVYSICTLNMSNNTLSGNHATGAISGGGALYQAGTGEATLQHATIVDNSAGFGAGIYNDGGGSSTLTIGRSIVANNATGNCDGVITSDGYNLTNDSGCSAFTTTGDVQNANLPLGPLADNGGPTLTRLPLAGNPAIDAIPSGQCGYAQDQRGVTRPLGAGCDSGAVEAGNAQRFLFLPLVLRR